MKSFLVGIFLVCCTLGYSQNCTYTLLGELKDFHDSSAIASALIFIKEQNRSITSNSKGVFKIENLCQQTLTLIITHVNCDTKTIIVNVTNDMVKTITLEHHVEELGEVTVSGSGLRQETKTAQEAILSAEELKRYNSLSLGDALKEIPGVSSINTGNTIVKPMVNGLHSSRLIIVNNNVRLQDQEWGIEHAPSVDITAANQISVIKGAGALAYGGDAIGGVIIMRPKRVYALDTLYGRLTLSGQTNGNGYNANAAINKGYKNGWFAKLNTGIKQSGDFKAPDYYLTNTGIQSQHLSISTGQHNFEFGFDINYSYLNNKIGILRSSHLGNVSDLVNAINFGDPLVIEDFSYDINNPKQEVTHHMLKAVLYKRFKNFGKVNLQYDYQNNRRLEFDVRRGDNRNKAALDLELQTHSFLLDAVYDAKQTYELKFGLLGRYQNNFPNPNTGVRRFIPDYDKYDFGAYIISTFNVSDNTTLEAGLRYDFNTINAEKFYLTSRWNERNYNADFADIIIKDLGTQLLTNPVFDFHNISASAGIKHELNNNNTLLFNYSLATRPPNPAELFSDGLHHSAARFEIGDLRFNKEISNRLGLSYMTNTSVFNFTAEVYYNRINDFILLEPESTLLTNRGEFPVWEYRQTNAEIYGIDLNANYDFNSHFNLNNKISYTIGNDKDTNLPLIHIPAFNNIATLSYTNEKWSNFKTSLRSELVLEQTQFPDNDFETFIPTTEEFVNVAISAPPPSYHLVHFSAETTFKFRNKQQLNTAIYVDNVFNINYRNYLNNLRYFSDDLGRNIRLQIQYNF